MRLIDADELIKPMQESYNSAGLHGEDYRKVMKWIKRAPTVEPTFTFDQQGGKCEQCAFKLIVENITDSFEDQLIHGKAGADRPKGKWEPVFDNTWMCTNCEATEQFGINIESASDFCPNCGADMRGDTTDE